MNYDVGLSLVFESISSLLPPIVGSQSEHKMNSVGRPIKFGVVGNRFAGGKLDLCESAARALPDRRFELIVLQHQQREPTGVGRPFHAAHLLLRRKKLLRFGGLSVDDPHLDRVWRYVCRITEAVIVD